MSPALTSRGPIMAAVSPGWMLKGTLVWSPALNGRVISSCGLIMAATLGSMMAGDVRMLQQLGFALALGMLIDTFVIRPLLLPSFIVLTRRTLARAAAFIRKAEG